MKHQLESFAFDKLGVPPSTAIAGGVIIAACWAVAFAAYGAYGILGVMAVVAVLAVVVALT